MSGKRIFQGVSLPDSKRIGSVCFVCEMNQGRSVHLELSTRHRLRARGSRIRVSSAGLRAGGRIKPLRQNFLLHHGIPAEEIEAHRATIFGAEHAQADLILVVELPMKARILAQWPELQGRIMTVRGFVQGFQPECDPLPEAEAHIEDAGRHTVEEKLALYAELETLADQVVLRLLATEAEDAT